MWDVCIVSSESNSKRKSPWSIDRLKCSASIGGFVSSVPCSRRTQPGNQNRTMTSVKTVHHLIGEDYWKLVWWDGLAKKKFQSFRVYQASLFQADRRPFIYIIYFRVTAWLDNFSSVRRMYSFLWEQQQKKRHLINRSTKMQCLNRRLRCSGALQPPSDSSIFLRGTIMPQNSGNLYERSNQYWRPISWLQWR